MFKNYALISLLLAFLLVITPVYSQDKNQNSTLIVPIHSNQFSKEVEEGKNCYGDVCGQKGVVSYFKNENKMSINTQGLINKYGTTEIKSNLQDLQVFLDRENDVDLMDLGFVFNDTIDCGSIYLGDIDRVEFPGVDKMRAVYAIDTQGSLEGVFVIRVYANKGDQYIMLKAESTLGTNDKNGKPAKLYQKCKDAFNIEGDPSDNCSFMECYREKVQTNGVIQGILSRQTQTLIDQFAVK